MKKLLVAGNDFMGYAAIHAGCRFYAGYPITPQNELTAYMSRNVPEAGGAFVQAESELAAINMVFGAGASGIRTMTSSSSPGISLKQEGISYMAGCQIPAVIINVMRAGPGLGYITPSQSDYFQATKGGGHGDYNLIVLAPSTVEEAGRLVVDAFALADKYRNPVLILADAFIGQMMESVDLSSLGKAYNASSSSKKDWALTGCKGRAPYIIRSLFTKPEDLKKHNAFLQKKFDKMRKENVRVQTQNIKDAEYIIVAYGTSARISSRAVMELREKGKKVGLIRPISLWPYPYEAIEKASKKAKRILVVEMSSGQMLEDVLLAVRGKCEVDFYGTPGGGVPEVGQIKKRILK